MEKTKLKKYSSFEEMKSDIGESVPIEVSQKSHEQMKSLIELLRKNKKMNYTKYTFFYKTRNPFSNWHPCKFVDSEGTQYNCSEQYMMAEKARLFGDEETREKILAAEHPRDQKALGRQVKNFNPVTWESNCKDIVYRGCYLKFSQNPKLLNFMMETQGTLLVEAAVDDRVWGIGLGEDDPRIHDPKNWKGTNWLGEVLTRLRDDILASNNS